MNSEPIPRTAVRVLAFEARIKQGELSCGSLDVVQHPERFGEIKVLDRTNHLFVLGKSLLELFVLDFHRQINPQKKWALPRTRRKRPRYA